MMLTEQEAGERWCPMVRIARLEPVEVVQQDGTIKSSEVALSHVGGCNTDALGRNRVPASCRCIGSQCAMWRWVPSTSTHTERVVEQVPFKTLDNVTVMRSSEREVQVPDAPTIGYCGLAGRPEVAL